MMPSLKNILKINSDNLLRLYRLFNFGVLLGSFCFVFFSYHWVWFLLILLGGSVREVLWHIYAKEGYKDVIKMKRSAKEREKALIKLVKEIKFGQKLDSYIKNNDHLARDN